MVEKKVLAPMYQLDRTKLSKKINEFCGSFPIVLVKETTLKDIEKHMELVHSTKGLCYINIPS